jgi:hypothetical protein
MNHSPNDLWFFVLMSLFGVIGLIVLSFGHPSEYSLMPRCPFYLLTGWYCPGCGSLRAAHYLLHGHILTSFRYNPLFLPIMICVLFLCGKRVYELWNHTIVPFRYELWFYKIILLVFIAFFIIRNIPIASLEWLRPPEPIHQPGLKCSTFCE